MKLWYFFGYKFVEGKCYIVGGDWCIVMEVGVWVECDFYSGIVFGIVCLFGN